MARRFGVTIDCADPAALAAFWADLLGYRVDEGPSIDGPEAERNAWAATSDPDGVGPIVFFQRVPEGKVAKNRMHLDIETGGDGTYEERRERIETERERLKGLGASDHRGAQDEPPSYWVRMNDPDGNEFCLV
jgi:hypothetical protein